MSEQDALTPLRELVTELLEFDVLIHPVPHGVDVPDDYERGVNDAGVRAKAVLEQVELHIRYAAHPRHRSPTSEEQAMSEAVEIAWRCEAHGIVTTGDCARCDDELIALTEASNPSTTARCFYCRRGACHSCVAGDEACGCCDPSECPCSLRTSAGAAQ